MFESLSNRCRRVVALCGLTSSNNLKKNHLSRNSSISEFVNYEYDIGSLTDTMSRNIYEIVDAIKAHKPVVLVFSEEIRIATCNGKFFWVYYTKKDKKVHVSGNYSDNDITDVDNVITYIHSHSEEFVFGYILTGKAPDEELAKKRAEDSKYVNDRNLEYSRRHFYGSGKSNLDKSGYKIDLEKYQRKFAELSIKNGRFEDIIQNTFDKVDQYYDEFLDFQRSVYRYIRSGALNAKNSAIDEYEYQFDLGDFVVKAREIFSNIMFNLVDIHKSLSELLAIKHSDLQDSEVYEAKKPFLNKVRKDLNEIITSLQGVHKDMEMYKKAMNMADTRSMENQFDSMLESQTKSIFQMVSEAVSKPKKEMEVLYDKDGVILLSGPFKKDALKRIVSEHNLHCDMPVKISDLDYMVICTENLVKYYNSVHTDAYGIKLAEDGSIEEIRTRYNASAETLGKALTALREKTPLGDLAYSTSNLTIDAILNSASNMSSDELAAVLLANMVMNDGRFYGSVEHTKNITTEVLNKIVSMPVSDVEKYMGSIEYGKYLKYEKSMDEEKRINALIRHKILTPEFLCEVLSKGMYSVSALSEILEYILKSDTSHFEKLVNSLGGTLFRKYRVKPQDYYNGCYSFGSVFDKAITNDLNINKFTTELVRFGPEKMNNSSYYETMVAYINKHVDDLPEDVIKTVERTIDRKPFHASYSKELFTKHTEPDDIFIALLKNPLRTMILMKLKGIEPSKEDKELAMEMIKKEKKMELWEEFLDLYKKGDKHQIELFLKYDAR